MRHGNKVNHLGRKTGHRAALLKNLSCSLIMHKRINTTIAKAKVLRTYLEPLITKAKDNTTHSRRVVFSYLMDNDASKELFGVIAEKVADRPGGYLRIIKTGFRLGDGAPTAMIEFVDFNDVYTAQGSKTDSKKKRTRRSGAGKKETTVKANVPEAIAPVVEDKIDEVAEEKVMDQTAPEIEDKVSEVEAPVEEVPEEIVPVEEVTEEVAPIVEESAPKVEETIVEHVEPETEANEIVAEDSDAPEATDAAEENKDEEKA